MCYSGRCIWEQFSGDCGFPSIKEVRDKYPLPLCEIPTCEEEFQYYNSEEYKEKIREILDIVSKHNKLKTN
jgi:hypothetical protein